MDIQKNNENHRSFKKDYSKLESIFNSAVERINQKKIIYYNSDRLFSDESKREFLRETYKSFAWATPVTKDDVHTDLVNLGSSEIVTQIPDFVEKLVKEETESEADEEPQPEILEETESSESIISESIETQEQEISSSTEEFMSWYYDKKQEIVTAKTEEYDDLLINSDLFKDVKLQEESESPIEEEVRETEEEIVPLKLSDKSLEDYYQNLLGLVQKRPMPTPKPKVEDNLFELIKSIQEDADFYNRKPEVEEEKILEEELTESFEIIPEEELEIESDELEVIDQTEPEVQTTFILEEPEEEKIEFVTNQEDDSQDLNKIVKTSNRRVVFKNQNQMNMFFNEKEPHQPITPEMLAESRREYNTSKIALAISLILTGVYIFLIRTELLTYDYLALIMIIVGIFAAWELNSKQITLMICLMLAVIAGIMIYRYLQVGLFLEYTHLLWFLLIPLNIISSHVFMNNRKAYYEMVNKSHRHHPFKQVENPNESILFSTDKVK